MTDYGKRGPDPTGKIHPDKDDVTRHSSVQIRVRGLVQGVGFRPFVYRIARENGLSGFVRNDDDGVFIRVQGSAGRIHAFQKTLRENPPRAAQLYSIKEAPCKPEDFHDFRIEKSSSTSDRITQVSPDITVCEECLVDMGSQPHRIRYPFINCTHCGPRFTIIRGLPYDRPATTMAPFVMCDTCRAEYESPDDRRFHAQPVACNTCGPQYTLIYTGQDDRGAGPAATDERRSGSAGKATPGGSRVTSGNPGGVDSGYTTEKTTTADISAILDTCVEILNHGGIIAIKGLGGFHLMCDAENGDAVERLRNAKLRDGKPFAVMVRDAHSAVRFTSVTPAEAEVLASWRRPIVLLNQRHSSQVQDSRHGSTEQRHAIGKPAQHEVRLATGINPGCGTVGVMLPYMPFHYMLFDRMPGSVLVMTSGNLTDEPIVMDNEEAVRTFRGMADAILVYNRDIHNRTDDSVVFVAREIPRIIRRSRGYVPEPVRLAWRIEGIFAAGAELSHCFAVGKGSEAMLSQHIGDLKDPATFAFFEESVDRFCALFRVKPQLAACDLHPDYLSTRYAQELGIPLVRVQHHHAHIAACMAEFHLDEPVIGVSWDGTGLGTDNNIWGGEFLYADLASFERFAHFGYLPLPGGDKAAKQTWRTGLSLLYQTFGEDVWMLDLPLIRDFYQKPERDMIRQAIERSVNAPLSSAAGRLFDAVAAITGTCLHNSYHAEAPMKLEALADPDVTDEYPFSMDIPSIAPKPGDTAQSNPKFAAASNRKIPSDANPGTTPQTDPELATASNQKITSTPETVIRFDPMVRALVDDLQNGTSIGAISAKFHNTMVSVTETVARRMRDHYGTRTVILTGGVFQNRYLLEKSEERLLAADFRVFSPSAIPANDAGIALGQLAVAARHTPLFSITEL
jgi:hydrogenase maturation protein HypF